MRPFLAHQEEAFNYAKKRSRIALFMEMRLGKTLVALRWAALKAPTGRKLVVAPLSVLSAWQEELRKEGVPENKVWVRSNQQPHASVEWHLANYEYIRNNPNWIHIFDVIIPVMLAQIACGSMGLDWSVASTAIYYSNSYEAEDRTQSEDRIVHPLKKEPLLYIDLLTEASIDEEVLSVLQEKSAVSQSFLIRLLVKWKAKNRGKIK